MTSAAPSVEFQVLASRDRRFANMLSFLVHSISAKAGLGARWRMVVTFGLDGDLTPASPELAWSRNFPVEFRYTPEALWAAHKAEAKRNRKKVQIYNANSLHQLDQHFASDVVVFMDADTLVVGSIADAVERAVESQHLLAWPAWNPPPVDAAGFLAELELADDGRRAMHSGYGWSFLEPREGLPYFNYGFVVCPNRIANLLARAVPEEMRRLMPLYSDGFIWQLALTAAILRHNIPFAVLPERYNFGNGDDMPPLLKGEEGERLVTRQREDAEDLRVLHYCVTTANFDKHRLMADPALLAAFLNAEDLTSGETLLQEALRRFAAPWQN